MSARRRSDRSPDLLWYTGVTVVLGIAATAWAITTFPLDPAISLTARGDSEGILLGLVFWTGLALLGGLRVQHLHGHGVLTFHLPFIVAAMALGGPAAGAIVALLGTFERREFEEMPWYGALSNHAHMALAAVIGGVVCVVAEGLVADAVGAVPEAGLIAVALGGLTFGVVGAALAEGTVMLRDDLTTREALSTLDTSFRVTATAEVVVGWLLFLTFGAIGWWAALITAGLVLVIWQGHDAREIARHDPLTGLLSRAGFEARLQDAARAAGRHGRGFTVIAIDLDGFRESNNRYGHLVGDDVIREVGRRIRRGIRLTDAGVRLGGDEYGILLADVGDEVRAKAVAERLMRSITGPMSPAVAGSDGRALRVGASLGVVVIESGAEVPALVEIHRLADNAMFEAKRQSGDRRARVAGAARGEGRMVIVVIRATGDDDEPMDEERPAAA